MQVDLCKCEQIQLNARRYS